MLRYRYCRTIIYIRKLTRIRRNKANIKLRLRNIRINHTRLHRNRLYRRRLGYIDRRGPHVVRSCRRSAVKRVVDLGVRRSAGDRYLLSLRVSAADR